jgi:predicted GNAT superfamily acetyltransferase
MSELSIASAAAYVDAEAAAAHAKVSVQDVVNADIQGAQGLIAQMWGEQGDSQSQLLQAVLHAGNPVLIAIRDGGPVGAAFGFLGWDRGVHLHSYVVGVLDGHQSQGIGFALKLMQRAVCLREGVSEMRWTFDPLLARNAHFNVVKLGARVHAFYPDFYGQMTDDVNLGDQSDRFEVTWDLKAPLGAIPHSDSSVEGHVTELVHVPDDYLELRQRDPEAAREIRRTSTERFGQLFHDGWSPTWADGGYLFSRVNPADLAT